MQLDAFTMAFMTLCVSAILGALLLFSWLQNRSTRALLWWGVAFLVGSLGLALLMLRKFTGPSFSIQIGNALIFLAYSLLWCGARVFDGRSVRPILPAAGPVAWLIACQIPAFYDDIGIRVCFGSLVVAAYVGLAGFEIWRGRTEPLLSRWPTVLVMGTNAAVFVVRAVMTFIPSPLSGDYGAQAASMGWYTPVGFGTLVFIIVFAFMLLMMTKERTELRYKIASLVDPLTGMANRRAFIEHAETLLRRPSSSMAVLLFDLDHFKEINDRFGHALGDRVLKIFSDVVGAALRPCDIGGRLGGEEFAVVLRDAGRKRAVMVADRIRERFAEDAVEIDGQPVLGTVSIGVAMAESECTIDELLARADGALYQAKRMGRDRVEVAGRAPRSDLPETVDAPSLVPGSLASRVAVVQVDLKSAARRVTLGRRR
jgi:diguanylate cyclase (GGDEF)-like protein